MDAETTDRGESLCLECGLCCQGIFHTFVYLKNDDDAALAVQAHLSVRNDVASGIVSFDLPCPQHQGRCMIYKDRPSVCKKHVCDLLSSVQRGETTPESALATVMKTKFVLASLLPELKRAAGNERLNNPKALMETIDTAMLENREKIMLDFGVFCFLAETYFYSGKGNY